MLSAYPETPAEQDRWILGLRGPRHPLEPERAHAAFVEDEVSASGAVAPVATVFLTNRECPWRCLMCDLWQNTLPGDTAPGAIPEQIRLALSALPPARSIKLYNAGSFFDPKAVPAQDDEAIARLVEPFERVIVESHPALVGDRCAQLQERLSGRLEVAMGLETVHPEVLPRLNKRMTIAQFRRAADFLREHGIALRTFILVGLPWVAAEETLLWTRRAADFAFDCGSGAVSLIPTRGGNGAMDALRGSGDFRPPSIGMLEAAVEEALGLRRGRVFADLWNLETFSRCPDCFPARERRLREMNLRQAAPPAIGCGSCGGAV